MTQALAHHKLQQVRVTFLIFLANLTSELFSALELKFFQSLNVFTINNWFGSIHCFIKNCYFTEQELQT